MLLFLNIHHRGLKDLKYKDSKVSLKTWAFRCIEHKKAFKIYTCFKSPLTFSRSHQMFRTLSQNLSTMLNSVFLSKHTCCLLLLLSTLFFWQASQMVWLETIYTSGCNQTYFFPHIFHRQHIPESLTHMALFSKIWHADVLRLCKLMKRVIAKIFYSWWRVTKLTTYDCILDWTHIWVSLHKEQNVLVKTCLHKTQPSHRSSFRSVRHKNGDTKKEILISLSTLVYVKCI